MNIYEKMDLDRVINCSGRMTKIGVSTAKAQVLNTMVQAGEGFVVIDDLIDKAGEIISKYTLAEDSCVTASASSGVAIAVASVVAGDSIEDIENLPNVNHCRRDIIIQKGHVINFGAPISTMIKLGGGKLKEVGSANKVEPGHIEAAIDECTAALFYVKSHHCVQKGMVELDEMIKIAQTNELPLIIDAAAEDDLKKYVDLGCDMVIYSGAKAIEGPSSGFITGKREWIDKCKKQYLGIGRAMKVGKENIMGLLEALKMFDEVNVEEDISRQKQIVDELIKEFSNIKGTKSQMIQDEAGREIYRAQVTIDETTSGINAKEIVKKLKEGTPKVYVRDHKANIGKISFDVRSLKWEDIPAVTEKMKIIIDK